MRRYTETRDSSGELLRLVIPMMTTHQAGLHPVSYVPHGTNTPPEPTFH